jgi:hypothetical protein
MKCPICKTKLEQTHYASEDPVGAVECTEECSHGHYSYNFHWGYTTVRIGNKEFYHNYRDSAVDKVLWEINMKRAILDYIVDNKGELVEILI